MFQSLIQDICHFCSAEQIVCSRYVHLPLYTAPKTMPRIEVGDQEMCAYLNRSALVVQMVSGKILSTQNEAENNENILDIFVACNT